MKKMLLNEMKPLTRTQLKAIYGGTKPVTNCENLCTFGKPCSNGGTDPGTCTSVTCIGGDVKSFYECL